MGKARKKRSRCSRCASRAVLVVVASSFGREQVCTGCKAAIIADKKARGWKPYCNSKKNMQAVTFRNVERVARLCKVFGCVSPFEKQPSADAS
jgi:hypothetical protein